MGFTSTDKWRSEEEANISSIMAFVRSSAVEIRNQCCLITAINIFMYRISKHSRTPYTLHYTTGDLIIFYSRLYSNEVKSCGQTDRLGKQRRRHIFSLPRCVREAKAEKLAGKTAREANLAGHPWRLAPSVFCFVFYIQHYFRKDWKRSGINWEYAEEKKKNSNPHDKNLLSSPSLPPPPAPVCWMLPTHCENQFEYPVYTLHKWFFHLCANTH